MSDTQRKNSKMMTSDKKRYKNLFGWSDPRTWAMMQKGADGKNYKDNSGWRFMSARRDASGKLNTWDEFGAGDRDMTRAKRQTSKDTRRYAKKKVRKELDDL